MLQRTRQIVIGERRVALEPMRSCAQRMIAGGAPLEEILTLLAMTSEEGYYGRAAASILLLDDEGRLRNGASPHLPAEYLSAIDGLKPDPQVGACPAAAATGEIFIALNLHDDRWTGLGARSLTLRFAAAWSVPIKSTAGAVVGTFGNYLHERRRPTTEEFKLVVFLAAIAAAAIMARS